MNIYNFRSDSFQQDNPPVEKIVVFDEAQRAWTKEELSKFMKKKYPLKFIDNEFDKSEPSFLIEVMDRHNDWCVVIILVGGGQEINRGEAGLEEWVYSLKENFPEWKIFYPTQIISDENYIKDKDLKLWLSNKGESNPNLHLEVSIRSFRAEKLSEFVNLLINQDIEKSKELYKILIDDYPIYITRNYNVAKQWIVNQARGFERYGVLASAQARRLKAIGINFFDEDYLIHWFLGDKDDIRSSYFMEDAASEFKIQGLELDWIIVCWGADLYIRDNEWVHRKFSGTKWQNQNKKLNKQYLLNAYRVILTRARQGLIIFLPEGDDSDYTRLKEFYDGTYRYLKESIGIQEIY